MQLLSELTSSGCMAVPANEGCLRRWYCQYLHRDSSCQSVNRGSRMIGYTHRPSRREPGQVI